MVVAPAATAIEAGTVNDPLSLESATVAPPAGAAPDRFTVQLDVPPALTLVGVHVTELSMICGTSEMVVAWELPPNDAVTPAVRLLVIAPAVAVKVAVDAPAATVTDAGTVSKAWLLDSETTEPPATDAPDRVTVQVDDVADASVAGLQLRDPTTFWGTRDTTVLVELPVIEAVSVADCALLTVPLVASNVTLLVPDATVTVAGAVSVALLLETATAVPPVGAFFDVVTRHLVVPFPVTLAGVQDKLVSVVGADNDRVTVCDPPLRVAVAVAV